MKKLLILVLVVAMVLSLSACGGFSVPKDWNVLSFEDAKALYHSVDFTMENIGDYLEFTRETTEQYNDWDELVSKRYYNGVKIPAENYIQFSTPDSEFLIDFSYTRNSRMVRLDPQTLEEIDEKGHEKTYEGTSTISSLRLNSYLIWDSYTITFNADGAPKLDENGELWVQKCEIVDWKVERVRGHAEWIADIPDEYIMYTENVTPPEGAIEGCNIKLIVIEGEEYYYCYESYNRNDAYQSKGFQKNGDESFMSGSCYSFLRGRE